MKRKRRKRGSKKALLATLILSIVMCLAVVVGLTINFVRMDYILGRVSPMQVAEVNTYNNISLMISMLGVAVSVWVGLNIYNALSKEELNELLEQAERASAIVEDVYTEVLISKLRLLPADRIENYLAGRLSNMERLPCDILKQMIFLEDKFNYAYAMYVGRASQKYTGSEIEDLSEVTEKFEKEGALSKKQKRFLDGYIALRNADFHFFWAQYNETEGKGEEILRNYQKALKLLFGITELSTLRSARKYSIEECQGIALMANNICATLLILISANENKLEIAITAGRVATEFDAAVHPHIQAVFERNLGVALERQGYMVQEHAERMDEALYHYYKSYGLDSKNWKTLHCLGSWYRKRFVEKYRWGKNFLEDQNELPTMDEKQRADVIALLTKAAYWYWLEQSSNDGRVVEWLDTLKKRLKAIGVRDNELAYRFLCQEAGVCQKEWEEIKAAYKKWIKTVIHKPTFKLDI